MKKAKHPRDMTLICIDILCLICRSIFFKMKNEHYFGFPLITNIVVRAKILHGADIFCHHDQNTWQMAVVTGCVFVSVSSSSDATGSLVSVVCLRRGFR